MDVVFKKNKTASMAVLISCAMWMPGTSGLAQNSPSLEASAQQAAAQYGTTDVRYAFALYLLARAYRSEKNYSKAETVVRQALAILEKKEDYNSILTAMSCKSLLSSVVRGSR